MIPERYFRSLPPDLTDTAYFHRLDRLRLTNVRRLRGVASGERITRRMGVSIEFAGHRSYDPGDDLRYLDWNLLARLDTPYSKTFHEQEYFYTHVILDASGSMDGPRTNPKFAVARDVVTVLSYLILSGNDRLRLACFPDVDAPYRLSGAHYHLGKRQMPAVRRFLSQTTATGATWNDALIRYARENQRRLNRVYLITDALAPAEEIVANLEALTTGRGQVTLIRLIDASDRTFKPDQTQVNLKDRETGLERLVTLDETNLKHYAAAFERHRATLIAFCAARGAVYIELETNDFWYETLLENTLFQRVAMRSGE